MRPVILCGGSGTRLWPVSTVNRPKQFCQLIGDRTLLQHTYDRIQSLGPVTVLTSQKTSKQVKEQLPDVEIISEPYARDTGAAIISLALLSDPEEILIICPSDHHITDPDLFRQAIRDAADIAQDDWIVTLGIKPTYPETGYGYILQSETSIKNGFQVMKFVEKPKLELALSIIESGNAFWNAGIFVSKAKVLVQEARFWCPEILEACRKSIILVDGQVRLGPDFQYVPAKSIDYAILEKSQRVAIVPAHFENQGWSDLGSWKSIRDISGKDHEGNVNVVGINSNHCLGVSSGKPIIVIGLDNVGVIETDTAILVLDLNKSQMVKDVHKIVPDYLK